MSMIAKIRGTVDEISMTGAIIDVSGVGYFLYLTNSALSNIRTSQEVSFYTHHVVRENSEDLYGFISQEEKDFFNLLLSISGIGPKSAIGILNAAPIETIREGVATGDASHLTKVSGIGKKSAEKIIVELKDKIGDMEGGDMNVIGSGDAIEALTALGYSLPEARKAIQKIDKDLPTEEMVKQALKNLSN
ncbi:Holliday junction branch migration protein RuvA [Candidatus Pacebacteria bacterium]|nr:Holliday junction branch migration protein RuvA [Candidatus Paceibacterota bacterium]